MRESFCEIPIAGVQGGYYGGPQVQRRNKSRGKTNFNSRHNKINLQAHETSRQNKTNSRQNNINSRQNKMNSRQNKISSRQNTINSPQNKSKLTAKYTLTHGKIKNRQSRTTCSYFCSREIKNRNGLARNPDEIEEDHLCSCFQSITLPGID